MDPHLSLLLADELKAVQDRENYVRNATMSDHERAKTLQGIQDYGLMLVGLLEWLPQLIEHLEQNKAKRGEK